MIWYDISELENKISENQLSEKDWFNYVLAYFIMTSISMSITSNHENVWIKLLNSTLLVMITIWGLKSAYEANNEVDGKDFIKRFFAINWVIGIRMLLFLLGAALVILFLSKVLPSANATNHSDNSVFKDLFITGFMALFELTFYSLVIKSIRRLNPLKD